MESVQIIDAADIWTPIGDQPEEESQKELYNLTKLSDVGACLRDDQILRKKELMGFFAEKTDETLKN